MGSAETVIAAIEDIEDYRAKQPSSRTMNWCYGWRRFCGGSIVETGFFQNHADEVASNWYCSRSR